VIVGELLKGLKVRRDVGYLFGSTNSWLISFGGLPEGQCKVHADRAGALRSTTFNGM